MNKAIIRACLKPFSLIHEKLSVNPEFEQAIYLASPSLHQKINNTGIGNCHSIMKYWRRSCTRPTPFGLFAGCGIAEVTTQPILIDSKAYHARLDFQVLQELVSYLQKEHLIRKNCRYFPNSSIYKALNEYRYLEYQRKSSKRKYSLRAVKASEAITAILEASQRGSNWYSLLLKLITIEGCEVAEAEGFLKELIDNQVLISELEPSVASEDHLKKLISILNSWIQQYDSTEGRFTENDSIHAKQKLDAYLQWLCEIQAQLDRLNCKNLKFSQVGKQLDQHLKTRLPGLSDSSLFHVDTLLSFKTASPLLRQQNKATLSAPDELIKEIFPVLNKLSEPTTQADMDTFMERFTRRYESREVSFLEALDPDIGIGYSFNTDGNYHPFLKDLKFPKSGEELKRQTLSRVGLLKQKLLQNAICLCKKEVEITDELISVLETKEDDLPPSMSVMLRKVAGNQFYLESFGGVSAVNLISRFAHTDTEISSLIQEICSTEALKNTDIVFARLVHLPEEKAGNVLQHETYRQYEIPILSPPSVKPEYQIPLQDLYLSIQQGELVLRSSRLNCRIIPRLDTAHNHHLSELPVYRFLCDLQYQGLRSHLGFDWGHIEKYYKFLPRVSYQNVILHPASWKFDREDVASLKAAQNRGEIIDTFRKFCQLWQLPQYFIYVEGDRELLINADDPENVALWWDVVSKKEVFTLKEYFFPDSSSIVSEKNGPHAHQFVLPWINNHKTYRGFLSETKPETGLQRCFAPGSNWLYFKIYGKASTVDLLLEKVIGPLVNELKAQMIIDQWFFVRYADPEEHLRIRFHLSKPEHIGYILQNIESALEPYFQQGIIFKTLLDTYQRELARYHGSSVEESEALFSADSDAVLDLLTTVQGDNKESMRWQWAVKSIDSLLVDFQIKLEDKCVLMAELKTAFAKEFALDKTLKVDLDKKYRSQKETINDLLSISLVDHTEHTWSDIFKKRSQGNVALIDALLGRHHKLEIQDLLRSYIHMSLNRIFSSAQRKQEFVLYYFLHKHYHSQVKIRQNWNKEKQLKESPSDFRLV